MITHFYNTADFSIETIMQLVGLALEIKKGKRKKLEKEMNLALLFFNPSLRTRVSFQLAMQKMGGIVIDLPVNKRGTYTLEFQEGEVMDKDKIEHVKDEAKVLSGYCDAIAIRENRLITNQAESVQVTSWEEVKKDKVIKEFMKYATVPVINMESNVYHPCQGLADSMTIKSKFPKPKNKKYVLTWVPHPKALPMATPNSQLLSACDLGMDVTLVYPNGWDLDKEILIQAEKRALSAGGSLSISHDQNNALKNADVVCAKSWGAMKYYGDWSEEKLIREEYKDWMITREKMELTNNAYFMHCLPVRRNVEVTDEVLDGKNSLIYEEAENRLYSQMALLYYLFSK